MADVIRLRVRSKGKLISTKVISEEEFKDYLALAGTVTAMTNAPGDMVKDVAYHTSSIDAVVRLSNGQKVQITIQKVKAGKK